VGDKEVTDMDSYCTKFVDRMETDVEYIVELGVLPFLLRCAEWTTEDTENGNHEVANFRLPDSSLDRFSQDIPPWGSLSLLLRPGHYELLYPPSISFDDVRPLRGGSGGSDDDDYVRKPNHEAEVVACQAKLGAGDQNR